MIIKTKNNEGIGNFLKDTEVKLKFSEIGVYYAIDNQLIGFRDGSFNEDLIDIKLEVGDYLTYVGIGHHNFSGSNIYKILHVNYHYDEYEYVVMDDSGLEIYITFDGKFNSKNKDLYVDIAYPGEVIDNIRANQDDLEAKLDYLTRLLNIQ